MKGRHAFQVRHIHEETAMEEEQYTYVQFIGNDPRWDGRWSEVPSKTVIRTGGTTSGGLEEAEVHWPSKGGKGKEERCGDVSFSQKHQKARSRRRTPSRTLALANQLHATNLLLPRRSVRQPAPPKVN